MAGEVSPEVKRFIHSTINSVEQLEVLLFMMSNSDREWTAQEVSDRTRLGFESVTSKLQDLYAANLLSETGDPDRVYRYSPHSAALAEEVALSLNQAYNERKDTIIELIYSRPIDNIRIFADAFRLRGDN